MTAITLPIVVHGNDHYLILIANHSAGLNQFHCHCKPPVT